MLDTTGNNVVNLAPVIGNDSIQAVANDTYGNLFLGGNFRVEGGGFSLLRIGDLTTGARPPSPNATTGITA